MAEFGFADWNKMVKKGGGASYFSLKDGESAMVRFVYNTMNDIKGYIVHEFPGAVGVAGATISCAEPDPNNPAGVCKWCSMGNPRVQRVIIPVFNMEKNQIEYWKRTAVWVQDKLFPLFEEVQNQGRPIASQQYKIKRTGSKLNTNYSLINMGPCDNTTAEQRGEVKSPFDVNMIKPSDCDFTPQTVQPQQSQGYQQQPYGAPQQNNFGGQPQGGYNNFQTPPPTRRTADTF